MRELLGAFLQPLPLQMSFRVAVAVTDFILIPGRGPYHVIFGMLT